MGRYKMKNSVFILSFDRDFVTNIKDFHKKITSNPLVTNWFHYIKSSYLLVANTSKANLLSRSLKDALGDISFLLMEVNLANYSGYLPQKAWEWIDRVIYKIDGGISFDSILGVSLYRLHLIVKDAQSFKIGKTGKKLEDRRSQPDYCDIYPNIKAIYTSSSKELVDIAEAEIIDAYINDSKCDNEKNGEKSSNDSIAVSQRYCVYVVWR